MSIRNYERLLKLSVHLLSGIIGGITVFLFNKFEISRYIWYITGFTTGAFFMMLSCAISTAFFDEK